MGDSGASIAICSRGCVDSSQSLTILITPISWPKSSPTLPAIRRQPETHRHRFRYGSDNAPKSRYLCLYLKGRDKDAASAVPRPPDITSAFYRLTIHDLIHLELGTNLHRFYYHKIIGPLAKSAACIFTVSEFRRTQIAESLHIDPEKIIAIYNGVDSIYQPLGDRHQEVQPYIFYIGNHRSAKNIDRMIEAYSLSSAKDDFLFLFSGNEAPLIKALAEKYGVANRIRFTGFIPEEKLPEFYRGATALMYVSLNEGFGLPNIEAIACGTPVVTSNVAAMPEIVGEGAIFVDPSDVHAIADGIVRCIEYSANRAAMLEASRNVKAKYTWEKTAQRSWDNMAKYFG